MPQSYKEYLFEIVPAFMALLLISGCVGSKVGSTNKGEDLSMKIKEKRDIVNFGALKEQPTASLASRGNNKARGIDVTSVVGNVVSIATDAVKNVIANEQKKYSASYQFALTDLYFYDQLSNENPFDPVGMQFAGFRIVRTFINKEGNIDTAFTAKFSLDTTNAYEILNNSIFRLRLEEFDLKYAKAKVAEGSEKKLNMDIEITFHSSYVNQDAVLFDNVSLGKFYLFIRNAPLDPASKNHRSYYEGLKGTLLTGKSFIVPRSFGYHMEDGEAKPGYSQGAYTITVAVKENSKDMFVSKLISENTNLMIDTYKEKAIKYLNKNIQAEK
jgi:hypothetical protein